MTELYFERKMKKLFPAVRKLGNKNILIATRYLVADHDKFNEFVANGCKGPDAPLSYYEGNSCYDEDPGWDDSWYYDNDKRDPIEEDWLDLSESMRGMFWAMSPYIFSRKEVNIDPYVHHLIATEVAYVS